MDPKATLLKLEQAIRAEDWGEAGHALDDLIDWNERGGFGLDADESDRFLDAWGKVESHNFE